MMRDTQLKPYGQRGGTMQTRAEPVEDSKAGLQAMLAAAVRNTVKIQGINDGLAQPISSER